MMQWECWRALPKRVLVLGFAVLVIALLAGLAYQYDQQQNEVLKQATIRYNKAQQQVQLLQQEQADYRQYLPQYKSLVAAGFIGEERRQQWLQTLRQVREQYGLFEIDYDLSPQQIYQPDFMSNLVDPSEKLSLHRSVMQLRLSLLHEGDLLNLLSGLRQQAPPFIVRDCALLRGVDTPPAALQPNLKAQCEIDWLTVKQSVLKEAS